MRTRASVFTLPALVLPAVVVLLLAGCAGPEGESDPASGDGGAGGTTAAPETSDGAGGTGCPYGVWSLDVPDLATQLEASLESSMGRDAAVVASGEQRIEWGDDDAVEFSTDLTITVTTSLDDGIEMVMTQHHTGGANGALDYADVTAIAPGWDSDYAVPTTLTIGGIETPSDATPIDGFFDASTPMQVTCEGDAMVTNTAPSPYTQRWLRES